LTTAVRVATPEERLSRRALAAIALAGTSLAVIMLDATGVNLAFPFIERSFPTTPRTTLAWMSTGYSMSLAALMLAAGRLADRYGRRRVFQVGMAVFGVSSLLSALAPGPLSIIALRFVTGAGGALVMSTGLALALPEFSAGRRALAVGLFGSIGSLAVATGPVVAALLVEHVHWRAVFAVAPILALPAAAVAPRVVGEFVHDRADEPIDWLGAVTGTLGIGAVILGLLQSSRTGWSSPLVVGSLALAAAMAPVFLWRCATHPAPLVSLGLFRERHFALGNLNQCGTQLPLFAWMFAMPLFLVNVWGWSVMAAGLSVGVPMLFALSSIPAGRVADRVGHRRVLVVGGLFGLASSVWLAVRAGPEPSVWGVLAPEVVLWGLAAGIAGTTGTSASLHGVAPAVLTQANAAHQTVRRLGQSFGPVMVVMVIGDRSADSAGRFRPLWWLLAGWWALSVVAAGFYPGRTRRGPATR
jgi:MFS family permease